MNYRYQILLRYARLIGRSTETVQRALTAFGQMEAKDEVQAEDFYALNEAAPHVRSICVRLFGTADVRSIREQVSGTSFVKRIIPELYNLPQAA